MSASAIQTHTVVVDELRIRYADSGTADGPVIVFTSPWPESLFAFRRVWPDLTRTGRLVAVSFCSLPPGQTGLLGYRTGCTVVAW